MTRSHRRSRHSGATGAFTLVEIVLVVAIIATLGGLVVASLGDAQDQSTRDLGLHELDQVRRAVLQFKADTGFLPKRGPFNLHESEVAAGRALDRGRVRLSKLPLLSSDAGMSSADRVAWFDAPANLWQLFICPFPTDPSDPDFHPLSRWDPGRRRGWRGPYIQRGSEGLVAASRLLASDGSIAWSAGPPFTPTGAFPCGWFPAVADSFERPRPPAEPRFAWTLWNGSEGIREHARPIVVFDLDPTPHGPEGDSVLIDRARIVSLGTDGRFDPTQSSDDLVLFLLR